MRLRNTNGRCITDHESLEDYAEVELEGNPFEGGALEAATARAENNSKAIGRLLDVLAGRGLLNVDEVVHIVNDYSFGEKSFES